MKTAGAIFAAASAQIVALYVLAVSRMEAILWFINGKIDTGLLATGWLIAVWSGAVLMVCELAMLASPALSEMLLTDSATRRLVRWGLLPASHLHYRQRDMMQFI